MAHDNTSVPVVSSHLDSEAVADCQSKIALQSPDPGPPAGTPPPMGTPPKPENDSPLHQLCQEVPSPRGVLRPAHASCLTPPAAEDQASGSECSVRCRHCSGQLSVFMVAPVDQFVCDLCDSVMSGGVDPCSVQFAEDLMSCRDCDFDVCRVCYAATPGSSSPKSSTPDAELRRVADLADRVAVAASPESPVVSPGASMIATMKRQLEAEGKAIAFEFEAKTNEAKLKQEAETRMLDEALANAFVRSASSSPK